MGKYPINGGFSIATLDYWAWCPMLRDRPVRLDRARVAEKRLVNALNLLQPRVGLVATSEPSQLATS